MKKWIGILVAGLVTMAISIVVNVYTVFFTPFISILTFLILGTAAALLYFFSGRISDWWATSSERRLAEQIESIQRKMASITELKNDTSKMIAKATLQVAALIVAGLAILAMIFWMTLSWSSEVQSVMMDQQWYRDNFISEWFWVSLMSYILIGIFFVMLYQLSDFWDILHYEEFMHKSSRRIEKLQPAGLQPEAQNDPVE